MPPRHAYWTIVIDNLPTAFRSGTPEELRPTFERLRSKHPSAVMRWFARGRLWESPEAARQPRPGEKTRASRGRDWRPGGEHRDPRDRFRKEQQARWRALRERAHTKRTAGRPAAAGRRAANQDRPGPGEDQPRTPTPSSPAPPPGPDRPPRPGHEPPPAPRRPEEIIIPPTPPERGGTSRPPPRPPAHSSRHRR
jgi:hypothetical protein